MKKSMNAVILALVLAFLAGGAVSASGLQPQTFCPIEGGKVNKNLYTDYQGRRIYFCCPDCPGAFKKNPEKYVKKLEKEGVTLEQSPSGR